MWYLVPWLGIDPGLPALAAWSLKSLEPPPPPFVSSFYLPFSPIVSVTPLILSYWDHQQPSCYQIQWIIFSLYLIESLSNIWHTWPSFLLAAAAAAKSLQSCPTLCDPMDCSLPGFSVHGDSPGKNTGVGCHALLQGIFPTQGSNPGLLHSRRILYRLSHQGSPSYS